MSVSTEIRKSSSVYIDNKASDENPSVHNYLASDDDYINVKTENTSANEDSNSTIVVEKTQTNRSYLSKLLQTTDINKEEEFRKSSSHYFIGKTDELTSEELWKSVVSDAAYFKGHDSLFGEVIAIIFRYPDSGEKLSCLIISKHGQSFFKGINYSKSSKYYPAVENLRTEEFQNSRVRKCLAVSLLRAYASLDHGVVISLLRQADLPLSFDWDETMAGDLASRMMPISSRSASSIGKYLLSMGYGRDCLKSESHIVDVVYENDVTDEDLMDKNNVLAFLLGDQLEYLFDSFVEYCPEATEDSYKQPGMNLSEVKKEKQSVKEIYEQLINEQTEFTVHLVEFMQKQVVPLRVKVLNGDISGYTTNRLNHAFPPTIDEVTRINCIFLDMLKAAEPYGAFEVLKACGTTIPYFYKACMRNKAATKLFTQEYAQLSLTLEQINKSELLSFDIDTSQKLVRLSSSNLAKIQLLLQKLLRTKNWSECRDDERKQVARLYGACNETIMSFASDELRSYDEHMFDEKGRILADFAKQWPEDLRNGWLTRRVVGIFDVTDMISSDVRNKAVLGVFNDFLVVFKITDESYYLRYWNEERLKKDPNSTRISWPLASDILMHAIVNEVIPSALPKLEVTSCIRVDDIVSSYYVYDGASYIKLFGDNFVAHFRIDRQSGKTISDVIIRAKILGKSEAFHLFKNTVDNNVIYYTAHESQSYRDEKSKAPILITLNSELDTSALNRNHLFGLISLNFADSDHISMEGMTILDPKFKHTFPTDELTEQLAQQIDSMIPGYLSIRDPLLRNVLLSGEEYLVSSIINILEISKEEWDNRKAKLEKTERTRLQKFSSDKVITAIEQFASKEDPSNKVRNSKMLQTKRAQRKKRFRWRFLKHIFNLMKKSKDEKPDNNKAQGNKTKSISNSNSVGKNKKSMNKPLPTVLEVKSASNLESEKQINHSITNGTRKPKLPPPEQPKTNKQNKSIIPSDLPPLPKTRPYSLPARRQDYTAKPIRPHSSYNENKIAKPAVQKDSQGNKILHAEKQLNGLTPLDEHGNSGRRPDGNANVQNTNINTNNHLAQTSPRSRPTSKSPAAFIMKDSGSLNRRSSKIHRVDSSIHIHKELKKHNDNAIKIKEENEPKQTNGKQTNEGDRVKSWAEVRRSQGKEDIQPIADEKSKSLSFKNGELINNANSKADNLPEAVKEPTQTGIKSSDSFYDRFKKTVKTQEETVKENGIAAIPDSRTNTLSKSSIMYSPSVCAKLSKLSEQQKRRKKGANWIRLSSADASTDGGTISDESSSSTLSTEESSELEVAKSPYPPEDDMIFHDTTDSDNSTVNGTAITREPVKVSSSPISTATVNIKSTSFSPANGIADKDTDAYPDLHLKSTSDADSSNTFTDFSTLKQLGWSDVGMETILGNTSGISEARNTNNSFDNNNNSYSHDYLASVDISGDGGLNYHKDDDDNASQKKKTTKSRKFPSEGSTVSLCDLISDDSYAYIGEILAGNIKIGDRTLSEDRKSLNFEGNTALDYDNLYSQQLRESSLRYLASIIGSNEGNSRIQEDIV